MSNRTITLSDRRPVTIVDGEWPVIAGAGDSEYDGQVRSQANRASEWSMRVRQHADGRAIVYAVYEHNTNWQGERDIAVRHGVLLSAEDGARPGLVVDAIKSVSRRMAGCEHADDDAARWTRLADECIAHLPPETI